MTTTAGCAWTTSGAPAWITVTGGSGTGNGSVTITVLANTDAARSATVTIAGQAFVVTQAAASPTLCTYSIDPTSFNPTAAAGSITVTVTAASGCTWTTGHPPGWITVTNGTGTGNGSVTIAVRENTGAARSATFTIAGQTFTVTQAAAAVPCTYGINPASFSATAAGGSTAVAVTAASECTWTTSGAPSWVTVTNGSGTGNGSVTIAVQENTGAERSATLTIAGQAFVVTQAAAPCTYSINPTSFSATVLGGPAIVTVTTAAGCTWTTSNPPEWITLIGGSGTGSGAVTVLVLANLGAARTATLTIAGQSFVVTQAGVLLLVRDLYHIDSGLEASVTSDASWLPTSSETTGTGNGSVDVSIDRNRDVGRNGQSQGGWQGRHRQPGMPRGESRFPHSRGRLRTCGPVACK